MNGLRARVRFIGGEMRRNELRERHELEVETASLSAPPSTCGLLDIHSYLIPMQQYGT